MCNGQPPGGGLYFILCFDQGAFDALIYWSILVTGGGWGQFFHEAPCIRTLVLEQRTLQPCKPRLVAAVSLPVPALSAQGPVTPWDAASYEPRAVLPDEVTKTASQAASRRGRIQHLIKAAASIRTSAEPPRAFSLQTQNCSVKLPEFLVLD